MQEYTQRQEQIREWYTAAFPAVARYISDTGGSFEEAKDVFQDALVIYYEKTRGQDFVPEKTDRAYLIGIARNTWLKKLEREKKHLTNGPVPEKYTEPEQAEISSNRLMRFLERSGKKCMDLLQAVYYEKLPMKNIAQQFGFSGERSATVQKHKCLEKVRDSIKEKSMTYEDFYE